ncbi:nicotinate-nucleotide adenylyltransferase [Paenibacillus sp. NEAU-GSW1]|uniref:nicotinate-nucleotide adenylyltransferase n=1 Tax=Paenibacillus sp. NEAU-GSW1 TaxID=2682486 RepID=UPI0012E326E4|nr:nicotinate-nucleotide adenylyltransferase [Paenibacillus sp. NEAU-GSW1]MUT66280.1 nicotinate-nucleotide adenylyltransferase [Paenibacillus sp. NEAU-GSW1]
MSSIGIMGGTFDPIHIGHLIAAETALELCELDEVWFIPSFKPPLKDHAPGVDSDIRYRMVEEAIGQNPSFHAVDIELRRGGMSYSVDTAIELKRLHPQHSFSYIIGSDRINDLQQWHRIEELAELVSFIGLEREGTPAEPDRLPGFLQERLRIVPMPAIGVSSTDIRNRVKAGRSIRYLAPDAVELIIKERALYES